MKNLRKGLLKEGLKFIMYLVVVFSMVIVLNSEAFAITGVSGCSMENTLLDGEKLYVDKACYHFNKPKRGEIIIFLQDEVNSNFLDKAQNVIEDIAMNLKGNPRTNRLVKRVIGVPGDKIDIKDGKVFINDKVFNESYIKNKTFKHLINYPVVVPEGKLFVMGDNREVSADSRTFGLVDDKSVEGKVLFRFWPINKVSNLS